MQNVGFLVGGEVFHPGDAYEVPGVPVGTLLLPTSGPWASVAEGVDHLRAVAPRRAVQVHDLMLSEPGQQATLRFLSQLGGVEVELIPVGSTATP